MFHELKTEKNSVGCNTSVSHGYQFESRRLHFWSSWQKAVRMAQVLGHLHLHGTIGRSSWLLVLDWPSCGWEWTSVSFPLCHSAFLFSFLPSCDGNHHDDRIENILGRGDCVPLGTSQNNLHAQPFCSINSQQKTTQPWHPYFPGDVIPYPQCSAFSSLQIVPFKCGTQTPLLTSSRSAVGSVLWSWCLCTPECSQTPPHQGAGSSSESSIGNRAEVGKLHLGEVR